VILKIIRDGQEYGSINCSPAVNDHGQIDIEVWFCPHCGRIYARELVEFEPDERKYRLLYHALVRPCYLPLHDLRIPHPTFWMCADELMLQSALKEYFNERSPDTCPALANAA
jgi:hypothetical protein